MSSNEQVQGGNTQSAEALETTIKHTVSELFEHMSTVWEEQRPVYVIAQNLFYLTYYVEPDQEISTEKIYLLAKRLYDCIDMYTQPFLNEERLDAMRVLLENGLDYYLDNKPLKLSPEDMPDFLLHCSSNTFALLVEQTAADNAEKYRPDSIDIIYDESDMELFGKDILSFQGGCKTPSFDEVLQKAQTLQQNMPEQINHQTHER